MPRRQPRTYRRRLSLKEICYRAGIGPKQYIMLRRELKKQTKELEVKLKIED